MMHNSVEDDLSRSIAKKHSALKDIIDSKLAKPHFDFLSKDKQDLQKNFTPQNT